MTKALSMYTGTQEALTPAVLELNREAARRQTKFRFSLTPAGENRFTITTGRDGPFPNWAETFLSGYFIGRKSK